MTGYVLTSHIEPQVKSVLQVVVNILDVSLSSPFTSAKGATENWFRNEVKFKYYRKKGRDDFTAPNIMATKKFDTK